LPGSLFAQKSGQVIWFDTPNPSVSVPVWGDGEVPVTAGSFGANKDRAWEHTSLPVGNGSIGANIMGSVSVERFTFNEKTLWRGGPRTVKNAASYWNVNKESAHVLKDIRQAFADGNVEKATQLTQDNFNSEVPYEADAEEPFRFGSFTSCGEFRIQTGLDEQKYSGYSRSLSLALYKFELNEKIVSAAIWVAFARTSSPGLTSEGCAMIPGNSFKPTFRSKGFITS
jgi:alpha-L-fucosidase 2